MDILDKKFLIENIFVTLKSDLKIKRYIFSAIINIIFEKFIYIKMISEETNVKKRNF